MSGPRGRRGLALLVVIAASLAVGSATPAADRTAPKRLSVAGLGQGTGPVRSSVLRHAARRLAMFPGDAWGGTYTTPSGSKVTVYFSGSYPRDESATQAVANFVDRLVHGSEISRVKIYLGPAEEVALLCNSQEVDGCYSPASSEIMAIGQDTQWSTVEEVLTHEFGHHVAANRLNSPWPAIAFGTKRWATYEGICQKAEAGIVFPGDEAEHYFQNPGEGFAESYLHLNEVKLGVPETPWGYDAVLAPDAQALSAIEQDVLHPWKDNVLKRWRGRFGRRGQVRTVRVNTPLDGVFAAELKGPRGSTLRLSGSPEVKRVSPTLSGALICGQRSITTQFVAGRAGPFAAAAAVP